MNGESRPGGGTRTAELAKADTHDSALPEHQRHDPLAGNAQRFGTSRRTAPLGLCGCIRDPEHDRHRCKGEISDVMADGAVAAVMHLDRLGTPGLLDDRTCRAVWRIGHPAVAEAVHRRTVGVA